MKKILIVSLFDSDMFIGELSRKIARKNIEVWLFCITKGYLKNINQDKVYELSNNYRNLFFFVKNCLGIKKIVNKVDLINFHYTHYSYLLFDIIFNSAKVKIASIWGGDLYKAKGLTKIVTELFYNRCDIVTATNPKLLDFFKEKYPRYKGRLSKSTFGLALLDYIFAVDKTKNEFSNKEIEGKKVICIGTNATLGQNHFKILEAISKIKDSHLMNLYLIVPMTYPKNKKYTNEVTNILEKLNIKYLLIKDFISLKKLADLRKITDILIQVQNTDQFSGAMQETIYAGAEVITGDWLPYEILDKNGVRLEKVSSFDEIGEKLVQLLQKGKMPPEEIEHRRKVIHKLSSWESVTKDWLKLYE